MDVFDVDECRAVLQCVRRCCKIPSKSTSWWVTGGDPVLTQEEWRDLYSLHDSEVYGMTATTKVAQIQV